MKLIDTHTHLQFRGREEFKSLVARGYEAAITCAFYPVVPRGPDTVLDMFDVLLKRYSGNVEGLKIYVALGIHPRSIPQKNMDVVLRYLVEYLRKENVVAIGEVGLETGEEVEKSALRPQLEIARDTDSRVILHTPKENKEKVFREELELIIEARANPLRIVVDHNDETTIKAVLQGGFMAGLTVSKGKLNTERAIAIIKEYEKYSDRFLLNTDLGYSSEYIYNLPETVTVMERELGPALAKKVAYDNAKKFFGL